MMKLMFFIMIFNFLLIVLREVFFKSFLSSEFYVWTSKVILFKFYLWHQLIYELFRELIMNFR